MKCTKSCILCFNQSSVACNSTDLHTDMNHTWEGQGSGFHRSITNGIKWSQEPEQETKPRVTRHNKSPGATHRIKTVIIRPKI